MRVLLLLPLLLASCASDAMGLAIQAPEHEICVDSLRPTLRWEPFDPSMLTVRKDSEPFEVGAITYELRVWQEGADKVELVYHAGDLEEARHELLAPLEPGARYLWSVRATFLLNGAPRVTKWALEDDAADRDAVPSSACHSFVTPPVGFLAD